MKVASNDIFDLIHSLTEKEQRSFEIFCHNKADKNSSGYLRLFNVYRNQQVPDEKEIIARCALNNFSRVKNYLREQLMEFLTQCPASAVEDKVLNGLRLANDLRKRSLYEQSLQVLQKLEKVALDIDDQVLLVFIRDRIVSARSYIGTQEHLEASIDYLDKERLESAEKIRTESAYVSTGLKMRIHSHKRYEHVKDNKLSLDVNKLIEQDIENGVEAAPTFRSKLLFHVNSGCYYQQTGRIDLAQMHFESQAAMFRNNPVAQTHHFITYLVALNNLLYSYFGAGNFEETAILLKELKELKTTTRQEELKLEQITFLHEAQYLARVSSPDRKTRLKEIEKKALKNLDHYDRRYAFHILLSLSNNYFIDGEYKKALQMVISLDKFEKPGVIEDGVGMLKILKLVLYYELGKEDLLEYCLQNTQRYLFRHQKEFTLLKVIHGYISKSVKTNSQYEKGKLYRELEREINRTIQKNPDSHIYLLVNFQLWVRNKTLQFPFKEEESAKLHLKH